MALLSFVTRYQSPSKRPYVAHFFHHGTATSEAGLALVSDYCNGQNIPLEVGHLTQEKPAEESLEEFWRNQRLSFFRSYDYDIATAHHLNDVAETWIMSSLRGNPKLIPYRNTNVVRPLLLNCKQVLLDWCARHDVPFIEDASNLDEKFDRNRTRHKIMPEALKVYPGFLTTLKKKYLADQVAAQVSHA
jgi:tRNA(Ile)-lysidine synthase